MGNDKKDVEGRGGVGRWADNDERVVNEKLR